LLSLSDAQLDTRAALNAHVGVPVGCVLHDCYTIVCMHAQLHPGSFERAPRCGPGRNTAPARNGTHPPTPRAALLRPPGYRPTTITTPIKRVGLCFLLLVELADQCNPNRLIE